MLSQTQQLRTKKYSHRLNEAGDLGGRLINLKSLPITQVNKYENNISLTRAHTHTGPNWPRSSLSLFCSQSNGEAEDQKKHLI